MVKHTYIPVRAFRFRRFCRAAYAAFRSMHHEVTIGHVASYIADRQLRKSVSAVALAMPLLIAESAQAQSDDDMEGLTLPAVTITAVSDAAASEGAAAVISPQDIQHLSVSTLGELIEALPGVEVRMRGAGDMQGDIVMRGGTFDQVVVLLNGVNVSDVQTGHYNLDLPIDLAMVERIEMLPPTALARYGVSSFCGGINIVTSQTRRDRLRLSASGGSYGTARLSAAFNKGVGAWRLSAQAAYNRSDGYRANTDYRHGTLFLYAERGDNRNGWTLQLGGQAKNYGSQAFYSLRYPDQYEATRTLMASVQRRRQLGDWQGELSLYGRLHRDRFELFREGYTEPPAWYAGHNYHLSSTGGLRLRLARQWLMGRSTLGVEYRREGIVSNVLGDSLCQPLSVWFEPPGCRYTLGKARHRGDAFVQHSLMTAHWHFAASLLAHANSMSGAGCGYALSAEWMPAEPFALTATWSRSDRQPTFTDLYYHSATQVSDPTLRGEVSHTAELSARLRKGAFCAITNVYLRHGSNIIDWIRQPDSSVWRSVNHAAIDALGGDLRLTYRSSRWLRQADLSYAYCTLRQEADGYVSQYALDYLRHQLSASIALSPWRNWLLKSSLSCQLRNGCYTDLQGTMISYDPIVIWDATLSYSWQRCTFYLDAHNLLNRVYMDYGGIPQPGATFMVGMRFDSAANTHKTQ